MDVFVFEEIDCTYLSHTRVKNRWKNILSYFYLKKIAFKMKYIYDIKKVLYYIAKVIQYILSFPFS